LTKTALNNLDYLSAANGDLRAENERLRSQVDNCQANAHYKAWQKSQAEVRRLRTLVETAAAMVAKADPDLADALLRRLEARN